MEPKSNGRNFYQLFAEVLNDKNLNHAEKLLMSIIHGLADEDGMCFPSNEWLCEKLDLKERAVQDLLAHLEKLNYIRRELIPQVSNPMKKNRLIFTNVKVKFCTVEGAENCTSDMQKTAHIIDKKEVIDKKDCLYPPPVGAEDVPKSIKKIDTAGKSVTMELDDIFKKSISQNKDWRTSEIHEAWKILVKYEGRVNDCMAFIEGTIKNLRTKQTSKHINERETTCPTNRERQGRIPTAEEIALAKRPSLLADYVKQTKRQ